MSDAAPDTEPRLVSKPGRVGRRSWLLLAGLVGLLLLAVSVWALELLPNKPKQNLTLELAPQAELDRRWGTYLSEREWGNPREAIGSNGWGLSWRGAIDTEYRYGDDGIAGITDRENEFRIGWAFWDGRQEHVTERFLGVSNPQGAAGESIIDERVFMENTPSHSYSRMIYRYPADEPAFEIQLEAAKYDSNRMALSATVTNTTAATRRLHVILKGWLPPGGQVQAIEQGAATAGSTNDGLVLLGEQSVVAIVGRQPDGWQISEEKGALNENLRAGSLTRAGSGHIGAIVYDLELGPNASQTVRLAFAEGPLGGAEAAADTARETLNQAGALTAARRSEAGDLFEDVTAHEKLYRQALMSLLWNQSYYRWDGTSGVNRRWAGLVDARDVLIMPDKWEFPWPASWDQAFHAVTAALVDDQIAQDQIRFLLSERWQQPDGHIPCAEWVMDLECPPIFAWAAWRVYEATRDREFLAEVYPALQRHYDYWWQNHLVGEGLFTGGFLGMDNLPRSRNRPQADASAWMALFARDMARIASELRDPGTSERYWVDRGRIQEAINSNLWDEETGFYYDLGPSERFIQPKSYSGLIPLIAGVVPPERLPRILEALRDEEQFLSTAGIRSLAADSPLYRPGLAGPGVNSNWRGPVWLPINYMLIGALRDIDPRLAGDLRDRVVNNVEREWQSSGGFYEYFDGDTGEGLGADAQAGWTALVANLVAESWRRQPNGE